MWEVRAGEGGGCSLNDGVEIMGSREDGDEETGLAFALSSWLWCQT